MKKIWKKMGVFLLVGSLLINPTTAKMKEKKASGKTYYKLNPAKQMTAKEEEAYELTKERVSDLKPLPVSKIMAKSLGPDESSDPTIPTKYDSVSLGYGSEVKDQGKLGVCYSFAIEDATQTNYKKKTGIGLDLSEWTLAYFLNHRPTDPLSLLEGDGSYHIDENGKAVEIGTEEFYNGGNAVLAMFGLASGVGYSKEENASYNQLSKIMGRYERATLKEEKGYPANDYLLTSASVVNPKDSDSLKQLIMEKGAGTMMVDMDEDAIDYSTYALYSPKHNASNVNHVVSVVGWDDNYDKSNFLYSPKHNGAWLIKNSWGEYWGNDGYFWMSYEELSYLAAECVFYDVEKDDKYDHIYQYDGSCSSGYENQKYEQEANVFTMKKDETLKAVSFFTMENNTDYTVDVYKNPQGEDVSSGEHIVSNLKGNKEISGYQLIDLGQEQYVKLKKDDVIAVVVKQEVNGEKTNFCVDLEHNGNWIYHESKSEKGQSFVSDDGTNWTDISARKHANLRIKAFTSEDVKDYSGKLTFAKEKEEIYVNQSMELKVTMDNTVVNDTAALKFSSGDSDILSVDQLGNIHAKKAGTTEIVVSYKEQEARCQVVVTAKEITQLKKPEGYATKDKPLQGKVFQTIYLENEIAPEYAVGKVLWEAECISDDSNEGFTIMNGTFQAEDSGLYCVTASYENSQGKTLKLEYFIDISYDRVDCTDISQMKLENYDNNTMKYFVMKNPNTISYITFDEKTALEDEYDYIFVSGQNSDDLKDLTHYISRFVEEEETEKPDGFVGSYTGTELSNRSLIVKGDYIVIALASDMYTTDYGFSLNSIEKYVKPSQIQIDTVSVKIGEKAKTSINKTPNNASLGLEYSIEDERIATVSDRGIVEGIKAGDTTLTVTDQESGISASCDVEVTADSILNSLTPMEETLSLIRNEEKEIEFEEVVAKDYLISYSVEDSSVALVDEDGMVTGLGVGSTTVTAETKDFTAQIEIKVEAPETTTVEDMQSYHGHIEENFEQTYTYKAKDKTANCLSLQFDSTIHLNDCETIRVLDGEGKELYNIDGRQYEKIESTLIIPDSTVSIQYLVDPSHHDDSEEEEDAQDQEHGFRVIKIKEGKKPTGITMNKEIHIDMSNMISPYKALNVKLVPEDAIGKISYAFEKDEDKSLGDVIVSYKAFQAKRMGTGTLVATVSFMDEEIASAKTNITVTGTKIKDFSCTDMNDKPVTKITLKEDDYMEYNIQANEEFHDETFDIISSNKDIVESETYTPYLFYVQALRAGDTVLTIRSSDSKIEKKILVHVVKQSQAGDDIKPTPTVKPTPTAEPTNKLKAPKLSVKKSKKKVIVTWKKVKNAKKYELQYSKSKNFKKKKKVTTKKAKYIKKLKKGTYYTRVRSIAEKTKSSWSKVKKLRV